MARRNSPQRDKFLEAALRGFARRGFAVTTTREICADLGLAHSAIYNYFPSKESLLRAIEEREMTRMQAGADAILEKIQSASSEDRLAVLLSYTAMMAITHREAWVLMQNMLRDLKPEYRRLFIAHRDRYEDTVHTVLCAAIKTRSLPERETRLAVLYFFGILDGIVRWFRPSGSLEPKQLADHVTRFFMRALTSGFGRPIARTGNRKRTVRVRRPPEFRLRRRNARKA
jgi:TetR/AcrR family transcriptional regulator, cholesterol catabolism regulator